MRYDSKRVHVGEMKLKSKRREVENLIREGWEPVLYAEGFVFLRRPLSLWRRLRKQHAPPNAPKTRAIRTVSV